ncbi:hypothetical protein KBZ21_39520, partial [Streptomyces sp. A73]|nr:hypothetical protein [Streptomyces sp. A73]
MDRVFAEYRPVAFFADPGSGFDESDGERYWDGYIDAWAQQTDAAVKLVQAGILPAEGEVVLEMAGLSEDQRQRVAA